MLRVGLLNFSKGVLGPQLHARVDVAAYNAGLKKGENIIVLKQGGFTIRPGFRFISAALDPDERVLPFQFSAEQPYALALGQETLQPLTAGGVVTERELQITGATSAEPVVLEAAFHGYAVGDQVFVQGVEGELGDLLNGRIWDVTVVPDANHLAIAANGSGLDAFTLAVGGVTNIAPPPAPPAPPPTPPPYVPPDPPIVVGPGGVYDGGSADPGDRVPRLDGPIP